MAENRTTSNGERRASGSLLPAQLTDEQVRIIIEIEKRIREANTPSLDHHYIGADRYLKRVEERYHRVILLNGGRGAGKTSLLLTLAKRWNKRASMADDFRSLVEDKEPAVEDRRTQFHMRYGIEFGAIAKLPSNIRVLDIVDFDPLPPEMPLIAGLIQAWRPMATTIGASMDSVDGCDDIQETFMDKWHRLFQTAVAGWSEVSSMRGLIEQVLERQDQVENWQRLCEDWQVFVSEVLRHRQQLERDGIPAESVFVIMIDDCDLQVHRIRQLLPTLRMLYHPRVFFIVAGHEEHMKDMLALDFFGQQCRLANRLGATEVPHAAMVANDEWATTLARSSLEKVFPTADRWSLHELSLSDLLSLKIDRHQRTIKDCLNLFGNKAGDRIDELGKRFGYVLPGTMTHRAADQFCSFLAAVPEASLGAETVAGLVSQDQGSGMAKAIGDSGADSVRVFASVDGELSVMFGVGQSIPCGDYDIMFGTRPDFVFIPNSRADVSRDGARMSSSSGKPINFTKVIIIELLEELSVPLQVIGLRTNTYLSHAWTDWRINNAMALFAWPRQSYPKLMDLVGHVRDWNDYVNRFHASAMPEGEDRLIRYAYAWVYFQRRWNVDEKQREQRFPVPTRESDISAGHSKSNWKKLINLDERFDKPSAEYRRIWYYQTLPLLARPELGFPPQVQEHVLGPLRALKGEEKQKCIDWLRLERERCVSDAVIAGRINSGVYDLAIPKNDLVESIVNSIEDWHREAHGTDSEWIKTVGRAEGQFRGIPTHAPNKRRRSRGADDS